VGKNEIPTPVNHHLKAPHHACKALDVENRRERKLAVLKLPRVLGTRDGREDDGPKGTASLLNQASQGGRAQEDQFSWA